MAETAFERVLDKLHEHGSTVRTAGTGKATAQCPAHDDRAPSLSIADLDGLAGLHCHGGCATADVVAALGLAMRDLYDGARGIEYRYDDGRIVHRKAGRKQFHQSGNTAGQPQLYRLGQVQRAVKQGRRVFLVEGEKDVHALETLTVTATTAPMGATNFDKVDVTPLTGARVVVIPDQDDAGRRWAGVVAALVGPIAKEVAWLRPAVGKDAADHVAAGHGVADFVPVDEPEPSTESTPDEPRKLRAVRASDITMRAVRWLWETTTDEVFFSPGQGTAHWLPLGGLCLLGGREGTGKTTWTYRIVGQVTTGTLPGAFYGRARGVVVAATEDDWARTIVPRLVAAGADLTRVIRADAEEDGLVSGLTLPRDVAALRKLCDTEDVALMVLDPLMGTISGALDTHKDAEVRHALEPLSRLAHDAQLTILGLIHVNKSTGSDLLTRLMASRAFSAVARAVLFAAVEEAEPGAATGRETFLLGQAKNNLAARVPHSLRYHIEGVKVGHDGELRVDIWSSHIVVDGTADGRIDDLMSAQESRKPERETTLGRACKWLRDYLGKNGPSASSVVKAAGETAGFSLATIKRASQEIGVTVSSVPGSASTAWGLPIPEPLEPLELPDPIEPLELHTQTGTERGGLAQPAQPAHGSETGKPEPKPGECCEGGPVAPRCKLCAKSSEYWRAA